MEGKSDRRPRIRSRSRSIERQGQHHRREGDRDRDRDRNREDERDRDRNRDRNRDRDRDRDIGRGSSRDRERDRERDRDRDRDGERDRERDRDRDRVNGVDRNRDKYGDRRVDHDSDHSANDSTRGRNKEERGSRSRKSNPGERTSEYQVSSANIVWGNAGKELEAEAAAKGPVIPEEEKVKANFGLSGALAKDERTGNMVNGVLLKFNEPLDAAMPQKSWRLYVFKDENVAEVLHVHKKSCYLFGRDQRVVDVHTAHPSCSKQHAVLQYRRIEKLDDTGKRLIEIKPYIMDLGSAHGTFINGLALDDARYYELLEKDCIKFGQSSREYVLLHSDSAK